MGFGWELVVLHTNLFIFDKFSMHAWSRCEGLNKKLFYIGSCKGQTHFGMLGGAKMNSPPNEPIKSVLHSNLHTNSKDAPKTYRTWKVLYYAK
jgi:hypothetical protein